MKKNFLLICIVVLVMTACRKPEPGFLPDNDETVDSEKVSCKTIA